MAHRPQALAPCWARSRRTGGGSGAQCSAVHWATSIIARWKPMEDVVSALVGLHGRSRHADRHGCGAMHQLESPHQRLSPPNAMQPHRWDLPLHHRPPRRHPPRRRPPRRHPPRRHPPFQIAAFHPICRGVRKASGGSPRLISASRSSSRSSIAACRSPSWLAWDANPSATNGSVRAPKRPSCLRCSRTSPKAVMIFGGAVQAHPGAVGGLVDAGLAGGRWGVGKRRGQPEGRADGAGARTRAQEQGLPGLFSRVSR